MPAFLLAALATAPIATPSASSTAQVQATSAAKETEAKHNQPLQLVDGRLVTQYKEIPKLLPEKHLTVLGLVVGKSTLAEAKKRLGEKAKIVKTGDAGGSLSSLCYKGSNGALLVLESDEMGGYERTITALRLLSPKTAGKRKGCVPSSLVVTKTGTEGGVALGMTKAQLKGLLGEQSFEDETTLDYEYSASKGTGNGEWTTSSTIFAKFESDSLKEVVLTHSVTN